MARPRRPSPDAGQSERGAALVEFAIVVPILITLVLGIVDFGTIFNQWQSVRQGSREGARQAVVANFGTSTDCAINGPAALASESTRRLICLTKNRVALDPTETRVKVQFGADGYRDKRPLVLCVQTSARSSTGFFDPLLNGRTLKSRVQMRVEQRSDAALEATEEAPTPGGDWTWCTLS